MYRVLGADGKEYGPVDGDLLRRWISEGRANAQTRVMVEGTTEWQTLCSIPEFESAFAGVQCLPPAAAPAPVAAKTSGLAIASLVLGVLGFCGLTALAGLILGIVSLVKINRSGGRLSGQGLAIAGICVSAFMMLMAIPFMAAMTLPALARAKQKAQAIQCVNNMKQLALGTMVYAADHNEQFPPAETWCDAIQANVGSPKVFQCPSDPTRRCGYAFNANVGGKKQGEVNPQTVLLFESSAGWNGFGSAGSVDSHKHSPGWVNVAFADGHVQRVPPSQLATLRWDP